MNVNIRNSDDYPPGVHERLLLAMEDPRIEELWQLPRERILSAEMQWPEELSVAGFELASVWGQAHVFGVPQDSSSPEADWLSVAESLAAGPAIARELESLLNAAAELEWAWTPFSYELGDDLVCGILERRHSLWGVCEAIKHGYQKDCALLAKSGGDIADFAQANRLLSAIEDKLQEIDSGLTGVAPQQILSTAAHLPLLHNYRRWLVEPFSSALPWWLDGRLEKVAKTTVEHVLTGFGRWPLSEATEAEVEDDQVLPFPVRDDRPAQETLVSKLQNYSIAASTAAAKRPVEKLTLIPPEESEIQFERATLHVQLKKSENMMLVVVSLYGRDLPERLDASFLYLFDIPLIRSDSGEYAEGSGEFPIAQFEAAETAIGSEKPFSVNGIFFDASPGTSASDKDGV